MRICGFTCILRLPSGLRSAIVEFSLELQPEINSLKAPSTFERRTNPRITGPIPAVALDVTGSGKQLGDYLVIDNLSAGGFYVRLEKLIDERDGLFLVTQISQAVIVIKGSALRTQPQADGGYGLAFEIQKYQIFSL